MLGVEENGGEKERRERKRKRADLFLFDASLVPLSWFVVSTEDVIRAPREMNSLEAGTFLTQLLFFALLLLSFPHSHHPLLVFYSPSSPLPSPLPLLLFLFLSHSPPPLSRFLTPS